MSTTPPNTTLPLPQSTPIKVDNSTVLPFTTHDKYRIETCTAMAAEIKKYLVGPMPIQQFLDSFFPISQLPSLDDLPSFLPGHYDKVLKAKLECDAYDPFVALSSAFAPDLVFVNSSNFVDCNPLLDFPFKVKPDVSVYSSKLYPGIVTDSAKVEIFIEFKWKYDHDPFRAPYTIQHENSNILTFLRNTNAGDDTLGQITAYAAAQLGSQFRTHAYSVLIVRDTARLFRWDRSGTIVSEAFKYNESFYLVEFFRRYSKALPEMRGNDQSVSDPTPLEATQARQFLTVDNNAPLVKLAIPHTDGSSLYYIAPISRVTPYTPPGRATRGFPAYDVSRGKLVYLKDSWRVDVPDIWPEGCVYEKLKTFKVRNIPDCLSSGDIATVQYHASKTCTYLKEDWACVSEAQLKHFIPHRHYRLTLDVIGRPLTNFRTSFEMVHAVRDAIIGMKDGYDAGFLHRDFSPGNIIITPDGKGLLIDWDLSKPLSAKLETPRCATRTGTWQFMSANLISQMNGKHTTHTLQDDLESSIYVLMWMTLMYSETSDKSQVPSFLSGVLDPTPYGVTGGFSKADFLKARTFLQRVALPGRPALHRLIIQLAELFAVRYEERPTPAQYADAEFLHKNIAINSDPGFEKAYKGTVVFSYTQRIMALEGYQHTIDLFDEALRDSALWPENDHAVKQYFQTDQPPPQQVIKSGWDTAVFVNHLDDLDELDEPASGDHNWNHEIALTVEDLST